MHKEVGKTREEKNKKTLKILHVEVKFLRVEKK